MHKGYKEDAEERKRMDGAKVFVGDHLCGVVDNSKSSKDGHFIDVMCDSVVGKSIKIENEGGVAFCDISVYKGERFPTELPDIWG